MTFLNRRRAALVLTVVGLVLTSCSAPGPEREAPDVTVLDGTWGWDLPEGWEQVPKEELPGAEHLTTLRDTQDSVAGGGRTAFPELVASEEAPDRDLAMFRPSSWVEEVLVTEWLPEDADDLPDRRLALRVFVEDLARAEQYGPGPHEQTLKLNLEVIAAPEDLDLEETVPASEGRPDGMQVMGGPRAIPLTEGTPDLELPFRAQDYTGPEDASYLFVETFVTAEAAEEITRERGMDAMRALVETEQFQELLDVARSTRQVAP